MKTYRSLEATAKNLGTDETALLEFGQAGWIEVVSKDGRAYISAEDEYRSRFILHLRQKLRLTDRQIGIVLANAKAPYSVAQVPAILATARQRQGPS
jgi:hypothetical protein